MMKRIIIGMALIAALGTQQALASTTSSTDSSWAPNSLNLRIGAFFPGSSGAKFFGGETQLTAGLDYGLSSTRGSGASATDAYFDYMGGAKNAGYVHSGGIGLDVRGLTGTTFYGAGIGLYNTAVRFNDGTSGNKTSAGGKLFAGVDLARDMSLQLDYHIMPPALGVNPSGLGVEVGFRL